MISLWRNPFFHRSQERERIGVKCRRLRHAGVFYKGKYEEQCLPAALIFTWHRVDAVSSVTVE